jgi:membrane protein required for colicin V production
MNILDLGILILLALIVLRGYYRGLFQELAVLAGLIGGVLAAANFYVPLAKWLQYLIKNPAYSRWAAFILILVAVYWLTRVLAHLLQRLLYHLYLDIFERLLGGFFAFLKGALILGFTLMLLNHVLSRDQPQLFKDSRTAPMLMQLSRRTLEFLPADFKKYWEMRLRDWVKPKEKQQAALRLENSPDRDALHG